MTSDPIVDDIKVPADKAVRCTSFHQLAQCAKLTASIKDVKPQGHDYEAICPCLGWLPTEPTWFCMPQSATLKSRLKLPSPALNVNQRAEPVATGTACSDTPAIDGGEAIAQIFVGARPLVTDMHGIKTEKQLVSALLDNAREQGAPTGS